MPRIFLVLSLCLVVPVVEAAEVCVPLDRNAIPTAQHYLLDSAAYRLVFQAGQDAQVKVKKTEICVVNPTVDVAAVLTTAALLGEIQALEAASLTQATQAAQAEQALTDQVRADLKLTVTEMADLATWVRSQR